MTIFRLAIIAAALAVSILGAAVAEATIVVRRSVESVNGEKIEVYVAFDEASTVPRPGVLVFHNDLTGVNNYIKDQIRKLAEKGYVAMAPTLATSADFGGVTEGPKLSREQRERYGHLLAERSSAALQVLRANARVRPDQIAAVGYCHLGGPTAMNLARQGADVIGVATLWGGVNPRDLSTAWANQRLKPKIMVLLGGSDVETNPYLASFQEEMRLGKADWRMVLYGQATHGFTLPGPHLGNRGTYDPEADRLAWRELTQFLQDLFMSQHPAAKPS